MIPRRVRLSGFLSYTDEQEVAFDGASLWMLAGLNGSGKSTIFDAVTYALFGHHRGGGSGASELINKGRDGFAVEFDFSLDGELFQAKRSLKVRASGSTAATQQVSRWLTGGDGERGRWQPVADTNLRSGFDGWVREHIGLTYETFTSSVLLMQGRAEKLLDSTAKGRFEVLAGIVDLERYQRLAEKADGQRRTLKDHAESLANQLKAQAEVTDAELSEADGRIADADEACRKARAEVERLRDLEFQSRQWAELQGRLAEMER